MAKNCTDPTVPDCAWPANTFPKGLKAFHKTVGEDKTIWVHAGLWTSGSPYRANFSFASGAEGEETPPQGPEMWNHVFSENAKWGLSTIKQDHIRQQVDATKSSYTNVTVLKDWMSGMGEGASANGVGVLYCCAEPNIHMNGVTVPAAYAVRSSPDYVWGPSNTGAPIELPTVQWAIGPDAAFHWNGLGLLPYKDTFISNVTSTQKGGLASWVPSKLKGTFPSFAGYHETGAATHALMALLSMAHVTFSDAVGETNSTLVKQLIRADGMLLKADRPATAIDAQFQAMVFGAWPGEEVPASKVGSLFTMPCDPHNTHQRFTVSKGRVMVDRKCLTAVGSRVLAKKCSPSASSAQAFGLTQNAGGPKGMRQFALQHNTSTLTACLLLRNGGAEMVACDDGVSDQGFMKHVPHTAAFPNSNDDVFNLATTW